MNMKKAFFWGIVLMIFGSADAAQKVDYKNFGNCETYWQHTGAMLIIAKREIKSAFYSTTVTTFKDLPGGFRSGNLKHHENTKAKEFFDALEQAYKKQSAS